MPYKNTNLQIVKHHDTRAVLKHPIKILTKNKKTFVYTNKISVTFVFNK
jgi:hypothetical protein